MAGSSITAVADDLTGAAEIAAIGHRYGLHSRICTRSGHSTENSGLNVYDTDSRLLPAVEAIQRLESLGQNLPDRHSNFTYKKTDSILRGNVAAEVATLARSLNLRRILLVPANPSLGRTIRNGQYFVNGVALHETAFSRDPHHPARSAAIVDLLGQLTSSAITVIKPGDPLPDRGIAVGETANSADVDHWAGRLDADTLAAGGAEFFEACLRRLQLAPTIPTTPVVAGPTLVVTGALTPARQTLLEHAGIAGWPSLPMPRILVNYAHHDAAKIWIHRLAFLLSKNQLVFTESPRIALEDHIAAERIRRAFGFAVHELQAGQPLGHLVVEGGATAAAISEAAGWSTFDVLGSWAPGVISLRAVAPEAPVFTIKPGSYSWPETLWQQLDTGFIPAAQS